MDRCINWSGSRDRAGYGQVRFEGRTQRAHRVAYCQHLGIPLSSISGQILLHNCDNPSCVNPMHLSLGTQRDNVHDMLSKGRRYDSAGENNPRAKVSAATVTYIRQHYTKGHKELGGAALARRFGIAKTTVFHIINGTSWSMA